MLPARLYHLAVELHRDDLVHVMLQHLADGATVAAADHQDPACPAVGQQRHVCDHLVIDALVGLGQLHDPVQGQDAAEAGAIEDRQVLKVGALAGDDTLDREADDEVLGVGFVEPVRHGGAPSRGVEDGAPGAGSTFCAG
jgi:hypothetical protein